MLVIYESGFIAWLLLSLLIHAIGMRWRWAIITAALATVLTLGLAFHDTSPLAQRG